MKILLKKYFSTIAIIIAGLITLYFVIIFNSIRSKTMVSSLGNRGSVSYISIPDDRQGDTAFGGIFLYPHIPDTIPHKQYKKIEDSVNQIRRRIEEENKSIGGSGLEISQLGIIAMPKLPDDMLELKKPKLNTRFYLLDSIDKPVLLKNGIKDKDSVKNIQQSINDLEKDINRPETEENPTSMHDQLYYLTLTGYSLADNEMKFFISKKRYYLTYVKWDKVKKIGLGSDKYGHYQSKQIPIRYAAGEKKIMIPISYKQYKFILPSMIFFQVVVLFFVLYIFISLPIKILVNISMGKAFIQKNIRMLKQMTILALLSFLISISFPYLARLLFWKKIPEDFILPRFWDTLFNNFYTLLIAIGLFLIGKAFQKGYKLQQEQDLTI